jgi:hypothetical protein
MTDTDSKPKRTRRWFGAAVALLAVASLATTACSDDSVLAKPVSVSIEMASIPADLHLQKVGPESNEQYGFGILHGETTLNGENVLVELQCGIDYTNGSGPFMGFWTFTFPNGDVLAFDYLGDATTDQQSGERSIAGTARVIGGTGAYVDASGSATITGSSTSSTVGKNAAYNFTFHVKGL